MAGGSAAKAGIRSIAWLGVIAALWPCEAAGSDGRRSSVVDTAIAASTAEADAFVEALGELVRHLRLRMRVERRQDPPNEATWPDDVVASVWIDARAADRIDIRMTTGGGASPRTYDRTLARGGSTALVAEEVAQVVRAALESILETAPEAPALANDETAPHPASSAPVSPEAVPRAAPPARVASSGGFGLDAVALVSERAISAVAGPIFGAGAAITASVGRAPWRPSLWISGAYDPRVDVQNGPVNFDVIAASFRLIPGIELVELDALQVDLGVGGGVDIFQVTPLVVRGSRAIFDQPARTADLVLASQLVMRVRIASQLRLIFGFDLDYDGSPQSTTPAGGRALGPHDLFERWRLRPTTELGLCIPLWGSGACANAH